MIAKLFLVIVLNFFVKQLNCNAYEIVRVSTTETSNPKDDKTELKLCKEEIVTKFEQISNKLVEMNENLIKIQSQTELLQEEIKNIKTAVPSYPRSCKEIQTRGSNFSGIYKIKPALAVEPFDVLCDMETRGGGWTYLMSRFDGSQNFFLGWQQYKNGFGKLSGEFWLGLEHLYEITKLESMELLIELVNSKGKKYYAYYESFEIGSEKEGYSLKSLTGYNGDAEDSLTSQLGGKFSTLDKDQDGDYSRHCASNWNGAWWYRAEDPYKECSASDLNRSNAQTHGSCIYWATLSSDVDYCLKESRMMVRPRNKH